MIYIYEEIIWFQWEKTESGTVQKVVSHGTVTTAIEKMRSMLQDFILHLYIKDKQSTFFNTIRNNIKEHEVVMQVDFSENYTIRHQDEVQSAHWGSDQVAIYTSVVWTPTSKESFAFITDYLNHDKYATHCFNDTIINTLVSKYSDLQNIHIFSDGAAQHFKQKYTLCNMTLQEKVKCTWHFFASSHGKGAVDGIGGMLKHLIWCKERAGRVHISSAEDFAEAATLLMPTTNIIHFPQEKIEEVKPTLDEKWNNIQQIPSLRQFHCIESDGKYKIKCRLTSNDSETSFVELRKQVSPSPTQVCLPETLEKSSLKAGDWVIVSYPLKKSCRKFVGQIMDVQESDFSIKYLRYNAKNNLFHWPANEDIDCVSFECIVAKLHEPDLTMRGGFVQFHENLLGFDLYS